MGKDCGTAGGHGWALGFQPGALCSHGLPSCAWAILFAAGIRLVNRNNRFLPSKFWGESCSEPTLLQLHEVPITVLPHLLTAMSCRSLSPEGPGPASPRGSTNTDDKWGFGDTPPDWNGTIPGAGVGSFQVPEWDCGQLTLSLRALSQPSPHEHGQITSLPLQRAGNRCLNRSAQQDGEIPASEARSVPNSRDQPRWGPGVLRKYSSK